jgi:hypothetical protein
MVQNDFYVDIRKYPNVVRVEINNGLDLQVTKDLVSLSHLNDAHGLEFNYM